MPNRSLGVFTSGSEQSSTFPVHADRGCDMMSNMPSLKNVEPGMLLVSKRDKDCVLILEVDPEHIKYAWFCPEMLVYDIYFEKKQITSLHRRKWTRLNPVQN